MKHADVLIIGAGLSGLSAGYYLAEQGKKVHLLEARSVVGGRTSSWSEQGMRVESGLHRVFGFYRALPRLVERAGVKWNDIIYWEDEMEIRVAEGPRAVYGLSWKKPAKTVRSVFGNDQMLSKEDKRAMGRFIVGGLRNYLKRPKQLDDVAVLDYAKEYGVSDEGILRILVPLSSGVFFLPPEQYSAFVFFSLLGPYLHRLPTIRLGAFNGGMTGVLCAPIAHAIERLGGTVETDAVAETLIIEDGCVRGVVVNGDELFAENTIVATSFGAAKVLLDPFYGQEWFSSWLSVPSVSAITIQIELTDPAMPIDRTTFGPGTIWGSFAEQSRSTFREVRGRLSIILVPPHPLLLLSSDELLARTIVDGKKLGIDLEGKIKDYRVIEEPNSFYALQPSYHFLRPSQKTPIPGLTLAGDYTMQKYISTMEGAVVAGEKAAQVILHQ